jgi:hypothetical protein
MTARSHQLDTPRLKDTDLVAGDTELDSGARFGGGVVPGVHDEDAGGGGGMTASELAYQLAANEEDENVKELKAKVKALVDKKFKGDYQAGFAAYDSKQDGGLDKDELKALLADAEVGNGLTRGAWASGIIKKLDKNDDKMVQWREFEIVFKAEVQRA